MNNLILRRFDSFAQSSQNKLLFYFVRKLKDPKGLKEFIKDNYKIAKPIESIRTKLEVQNGMEFFNRESDALLNYVSNRAPTLPKGMPIAEKSEYLSKKFGVNFNGQCQDSNSSKSTSISTRFDKNELKSSNADHSCDIKNLKDKLSKKKIVKDRTVIKNSIETNETTVKDTERLKKKEFSGQHLKNMISFSVQDEFNKIKEMLIQEEQTEKSNHFRNYANLLKKYNLDNDFLYRLTDYPLVSPDIVSQSPDLFDESELKISNQSLLNKIYFIERSEKTKLHFPSVGRVLDLCKSDRAYERLLNWKLEKIKIYGLKGFNDYQNKVLQNGMRFHRFIESQLKKTEFNESTLELDEASISAVKSLIKSDFKDALLIESAVMHQHLFYTGRIDSLIYYKGNLCLVDWKTSDKDKPNLKDLYENPIQLSAYLGAFFNDPNHQELRSKHFLENGLIVHLNRTNAKIDIHLINYQQAEYYWYQWLSYLKKFWFLVLNEQKKIA
jgi:hypothetical protein